MIVLYGIARSRAQRCIWMLEELGQPYRLETVTYRGGGTRTPDYLAVNPNGKIPALRDGDLVLWESLAINLYLAEKYGGGLWPATVEDRGRAGQWSHWAMGELEGHLLTMLEAAPEGEAEEVSAAVVSAAVVSAAVADAEAALKKPLSILNDALSGRPHLLGADFSVADLNVAVIAAWGLWAGMNLSPHPALHKWLTACLERPAARKMIAMRNAQ